MVIQILFVGIRPIETNPCVTPSVKNTQRSPVNHRFQPHGPEVYNRLPDDTLKTRPVSDIDSLFFADVLSAHNKTDPVSLRKRICHLLNGFLRQSVDIGSQLFLLFRNIFPILIQVSQIL